MVKKVVKRTVKKTVKRTVKKIVSSKSLTLSHLIDLDVCVEQALELFIKEPLPRISFSYERPLVVGSGNAAVTGRIMLRHHDAVFADESTYLDVLERVRNSKSSVDGAVLISASGGKHAPIIASELKRRKIGSTLITNNENALAIPLVRLAHVFPKNPEPYTYNTSTYMGMILSTTNENPKTILDFIKQNTKKRITKNTFKGYDAYLIIIPNEFDACRELFLTKFDELFGPKISARVFTQDQIKHAKTVVTSNKECVLGLGCEQTVWGDVDVYIPLIQKANFAAVMAIGYYVIGNIQKQNPPYFKQNIASYVKKASNVFNQEIRVVE